MTLTPAGKSATPQYQPGDFSAVFADDIKSGVRLHTTLDLQQLEEWASELPMTELDELHADLKKALREAPVEPQTVRAPSQPVRVDPNCVGADCPHLPGRAQLDGLLLSGNQA